MTVFELNSKGRVWKRLSYDAFHLNGFFFGHVSRFSLVLKGSRIVQKQRGYCNAPGHHLSNNCEHANGISGQLSNGVAGSQAVFRFKVNSLRGMIRAPRPSK